MTILHEQLTTLIDALGEGAVLLDEEGRILHHNATAERILGLGPDALGSRLADLELDVTDERGAPLPVPERPFTRILESGAPIHGVALGIRRRGKTSVRWVIANTVIITNAGGTRTVLLTLSDATALRDTAIEIGAEEARFRRFLDNSLDGVLVVNTEDRIIFANASICSALGYASRELMGHPVDDFTVGGDASPSASRWEARERGEHEHYQMDLRTRDGRIRCMLVSAAPIRDRTGTVEGAIAFLHDVTDQQATEEQLLLSERRYASLFSHIPVGVYVGTPDGQLLECNDELARMVGAPSPAALVGADTATFFQNPSERDRLRAEVLAEGAAEAYQIPLLRLDGSTLWGTIALRALDADTPFPYVLGTVLDTTELQRLQKETFNLQSDLQEERHTRHVASLATKVGHEYNNIMHAIGQLGHQIDQQVVQLRTLVERGRTVTKMVMDTSRAVEPEPQVLPLAAWLRSFAQEARTSVRVRADVRLEPVPEGLAVLADPGLLGQALANLVRNAVEAMRNKGTITLSAATAADGMVQISVRDTGGGMDAATLARIYEPLFTTKHQGNMGLGLPLTREIIVAQGGRIEEESEPGVGSVFHLLLPAADATATPEHAAPAVEEPLPATVLVVDDEQVIADGICLLLDIVGIVARSAHTGAQALEDIARERPDVVVLDIGLPDMSGMEVFEHIAARWPRLPVVFSTGHAGQADLRPHLAAHVTFLQKPYQADDLLDALRAVTRPS